LKVINHSVEGVKQNLFIFNSCTKLKPCDYMLTFSRFKSNMNYCMSCFSRLLREGSLQSFSGLLRYLFCL